MQGLHCAACQRSCCACHCLVARSGHTFPGITDCNVCGTQGCNIAAHSDTFSPGSTSRTPHARNCACPVVLRMHLVSRSCNLSCHTLPFNLKPAWRPHQHSKQAPTHWRTHVTHADHRQTLWTILADATHTRRHTDQTGNQTPPVPPPKAVSASRSCPCRACPRTGAWA